MAYIDPQCRCLAGLAFQDLPVDPVQFVYEIHGGPGIRGVYLESLGIGVSGLVTRFTGSSRVRKTPFFARLKRLQKHYLMKRHEETLSIFQRHAQFLLKFENQPSSADILHSSPNG